MGAVLLRVSLHTFVKYSPEGIAGLPIFTHFNIFGNEVFVFLFNVFFNYKEIRILLALLQQRKVTEFDVFMQIISVIESQWKAFILFVIKLPVGPIIFRTNLIIMQQTNVDGSLLSLMVLG